MSIWRARILGEHNRQTRHDTTRDALFIKDTDADSDIIQLIINYRISDESCAVSHPENYSLFIIS